MRCTSSAVTTAKIRRGESYTGNHADDFNNVALDAIWQGGSGDYGCVSSQSIHVPVTRLVVARVAAHTRSNATRSIGATRVQVKSGKQNGA